MVAFYTVNFLRVQNETKVFISSNNSFHKIYTGIDGILKFYLSEFQVDFEYFAYLNYWLPVVA